MEMMTNISKLTRQAGLAFAAVLWLGLNAAGISSARAADVSNTCAVQFHPCKIDGAAASRNLYPNSRIEEMQKGCLNTVPVETKGSLNSVGRISEEACHRSTSCNSSYSTKVKYPDGKCYREHQGMDVAVPEGTPVTAAADGVILSISSCYGGGGNTVIMQHEKAGGGQYTTTYMHLQKFADKTKKIAGTKEKIAKGTTIGYVGTTGCSDGTTKHGAYGAHLHIELRDGGTGKGKILSPACASADALCDSNVLVPEAPVIENNPDPQMVTAEASLGKCGKLLPADNLSAFHQQGESGGDAGAFNKCWADDKGGCSYGVSQMVCYRDSSKWNNSTMASYLQHLQKNDPSKYKALEIGGSLQSTINAACNPPATQFSQKWQALASQDSSFGTSQREYIENYYLSYGKSVLKKAGMGSLLNRSPEMDMIILAGAVAGAGPMRNNFQAVQRAIAPETFETASDETIISAYYASYAEVMYSGYADKTPYAKRAAKDEKLALESLAIRKEMENGSSLEEASQKVTGKRACEEDEYEYPSASVRLGQASRPAYLNEYTGAVSTESADKGDRECNVESYRSSFKTCIFCDIFGVLFNTASSVAKKSYNALANGVIMLVCVGFALWLGITVMQFISSMEQKNPSILVKTILNKAFLVLIVVTLLRLNSADFFRLAMEPIFNTGFKLAQIATEGANGETCDGSTFDILTEEKGAGLPASMGVSILCTIKTIQDKILDVMALGSTSICVALYVESWHDLALFPHLGYLIVGLVLWIAAILLLIIYPFLLIDSVLQLTVATALLPAAIGAYAFKSTQKYVGKVWDTFLNCMFNFIFLSLIIFILTNGLMDVLSKAGVESGGAMSDVGTRSGYKVILSNLAWWGTTFLKLVFYMILGWAVLGEANSFAGSFAKSIGVKDIGSKVGGLAASTANTAAIGGLKTAGKATRKVGGMALDRGREAYNSYKVNRRAKKIENDDRTVTDADGNKTLQHRTWYGRKVTDTLQVAPDGTRTVTRAKQSLRGNKATSVNNDKFIQNKKTYDKDGNLIREETRMNTAAGKTLLNRDGTRNEVAIHAIRSGSGMSNDDVDKAIMNQMMQERMGGVPGADMNREFKDREVSRTLDDRGREVFRVKQTNADGSTSIFEMTKGDKRDMLTYTHIGKNGKAESYASDGIINKKSNYRLNKDGTVDAKSVKNNYAFAKNYNSAHTRSMDSNGKFNRSVPADEIMMSEADMQLFREQVATYGKDQPMAEFGK